MRKFQKLLEQSKSSFVKITRKLKFVLLFLLAIFFCINLIVGFGGFEKLANEFSNRKMEVEEINKQVLSWEEVIRKFPDYRDGYIKLAILNIKLGKNTLAKKYLNKALEIDRDSVVAKKFLELLK